MKAELGKPSRVASFRSPLEPDHRFGGRLSAVLTSMSCAAARIQLACRTVGHLGGVPFRLLGDRERPVFRAEGAIGPWRLRGLVRRRGSGSLLAPAAFWVRRSGERDACGAGGGI